MKNIAGIHSRIAANYTEAIITLQHPTSEKAMVTAKTKLTQAKVDLDRARGLLETDAVSLEDDAISPADLDDARYLLADTRSRIKRIKDALTPGSMRPPSGSAMTSQISDLEACADLFEQSVERLDREFATLARNAPHGPAEDDFAAV